MTKQQEVFNLERAEKSAAEKVAAALARRKKTPVAPAPPLADADLNLDRVAVAAEMERHEREQRKLLEAATAKLNGLLDRLDALADRGEFEQMNRVFAQEGPGLFEEMDQFNDLPEFDDLLKRINQRIDEINRKNQADLDRAREGQPQAATVEAPPAAAERVPEALEQNFEAVLPEANRIFAEANRVMDAEDSKSIGDRTNPADLARQMEARIDSELAQVIGGRTLPPEVDSRLGELFNRYRERLQVYERRYLDEKARAARAELKTRLDQSRANYVKAKKRLEDSTGIKGLLGFIGKESKETAKREHEQAESEYNRLRLEYVADNASAHLAEQRELLDKKLQELYPDKEGREGGNAFWGKLNKIGNGIVETYKAAGRINLDSDRVKNKFVKSALQGANLRTVVLYGLAAGGVVAGGGFAGGAIWATGRMIRGLGGAITSYGVMERLREGSKSKQLAKNLDSYTRAEAEQEMARLTARALLAGEDISKLEQNEDYRKLQAKYELLLTAEAAANPDARTTYQKSSEELDKAIEKALKSEKKAKVFMKTGAAAIGAFFASGFVSKGINKALGGIGDFAKSNNPFAGQTPLESHPVNNLPKFAVAPEGINHPNPALNVETFAVDAKGFEGDLLRDIKSGKLKLDWLKEHYASTSTDPHANDPARLVHRLMLDVEKKHPGDWDRISKGIYSIDKLTGEVKVNVDQTVFLPEKPAAVIPQELEKPPVEPLKTIPGQSYPIPDGELSQPELPKDIPAVDHPEIPESEIEESARPKTIQEAREILAWQTEKASLALNYMLGDDYDRFLKKTIGVAARNVDKIQNLSYDEFLANMKDEQFAKTYGNLGAILSKVPNLEGIRMRDIILKLGQAQAEKNLGGK